MPCSLAAVTTVTVAVPLMMTSTLVTFGQFPRITTLLVTRRRRRTPIIEPLTRLCWPRSLPVIFPLALVVLWGLNSRTLRRQDTLVHLQVGHPMSRSDHL